MEQTENKQKKIKTYIGVALGVLTMILVQQFLFKAPSYDKQMMQMASEFNKSCPIMVDAETRVDNTIALPGNIFQYNYTLINIKKDSIDTIVTKRNLEQKITNYIKTNPQMKYQRDHKTIMNYCYKDKNGNYLFLISITPDKYE